ncbi:EAL domain-containing protein [Salinimonas marina]|uniref:EAL domain-containing protein n=1 Tax=Salinimonas marina TaxID=2785918 RepID=A0A7S9HDZ5_9ALTE|nr:EAL domain-containing protein [Salinimonas marina]QPG06106.1 EAL domain-containing protein [Salinimonas marina]
MTNTHYDNDELTFLDEDGSRSDHVAPGKFWNVLVVDDDEELHTVTRLALSQVVINNRQLRFLHAYSASQARAILSQHGSQIALILLDVVLESEDAGLTVVKYLRETLQLEEPRIVLRTGQPGYAPEQTIITDYDINDYKTKTELTRSRLLTTVITSIRSYQHIVTINQSRLGLQKIIDASANLLEEHSIKAFCEGVVIQLSSLLGLEAEGLVCAKAGSLIDKDANTVYVLGAAGDFANLINQPVTRLNNAAIAENIQRCLRQKTHIFDDGFSVLYLNRAGFEAAVYVNLAHELSDTNKQLLEVFLSSIAIGYENVHLFQQLRNAAFRDWLTLLPNRNEFINLLEKPAAGDPLTKVVALIDISRFSDINDGLGQDAGNALLVSVATRLSSFFEAPVIKARISSDVFGLIGPAEKITPEQINSLFQSSFQALDHTIPLNVHIGFYEIAQQGDSGLDILKRTNIALNRAKKHHHDNFEYYAPEIEERTTWQLNMIRRLRNDFADRKLQLWFQPQIDLTSEQVVGVESLLRWPDEEGGFIPPTVFIPLAEYSGLIVDIGQWVVEESCRRIQSLNQGGYPGLRVAVNISMPQFRDRYFVQKIKQALTRFECPPAQLELEITESVVMDEPQIVIDALTSLKQFGVAIAIDDFGTGFSSMSYLQRLPLDRLKVDRSFVNDIQPGKSAVIAETIVSLGIKLGLCTIAEGVERPDQAEYMKQLGCMEAQGYLYAKPMPFDELTAYLESHTG